MAEFTALRVDDSDSSDDGMNDSDEDATRDGNFEDDEPLVDGDVN
jgi:hypothetical protein